MELDTIKGESPVISSIHNYVRSGFIESGCLGLQLKVGGKYLQKLNINKRPIAKKYREGKMKRTLKRE